MEWAEEQRLIMRTYSALWKSHQQSVQPSRTRAHTHTHTHQVHGRQSLQSLCGVRRPVCLV